MLRILTSRISFMGLVLVLLMGLGSAGLSADLDPKAITVQMPKEIKWVKGNGSESAVLVGDPSKPGIYVIRNRFPPGTMSRPHFHDQDRFVTVIKGTWWTASGPDADVFDPARTVPLKAGSFMMHPARGHHYDGAKDEEAIVQIIGMGPVKTTQVGSGQ